MENWQFPDICIYRYQVIYELTQINKKDENFITWVDLDIELRLLVQPVK
jgi:hypothetical protein